MTNFYSSLRENLSAGLHSAEAEARLPEDVLADLMRVAVGLSMPLVGPVDTVIALRGLTRQLEEEFPEAKKAADQHFEAWDRARRKH